MKTGKLVHGAIDDSELRKYRNMQRILGTDKVESKSKEEYQAEINRMSNANLREHAYARGVYPVEPRERLIKALVTDFIQRNTAFKGVLSRKTKTNAQIERERQEELLKQRKQLLNECQSQ